jgi:Ser/Thr protein kinase RdoA (MazF antagonist)
MPCRFGSKPEHIDKPTEKLLFDALRKCESVFEKLRLRFPLIPIHSDVHAFNVMLDGKELAVFDFDDSGIGLEVQDLPNCLYYLRGSEGQEEHVLAGYSSVRPLPDISKVEFETLLLSRQLVLMNGLLDITTAEDIEFIPEYLDWTRKRIDHFNKTGIFAAIE